MNTPELPNDKLWTSRCLIENGAYKDVYEANFDNVIKLCLHATIEDQCGRICPVGNTMDHYDHPHFDFTTSGKTFAERERLWTNKLLEAAKARNDYNPEKKLNENVTYIMIGPNRQEFLFAAYIEGVYRFIAIDYHSLFPFLNCELEFVQNIGKRGGSLFPVYKYYKVFARHPLLQIKDYVEFPIAQPSKKPKKSKNQESSGTESIEDEEKTNKPNAIIKQPGEIIRIEHFFFPGIHPERIIHLDMNYSNFLPSNLRVLKESWFRPQKWPYIKHLVIRNDSISIPGYALVSTGFNNKKKIENFSKIDLFREAMRKLFELHGSNLLFNLNIKPHIHYPPIIEKPLEPNKPTNETNKPTNETNQNTEKKKINKHLKRKFDKNEDLEKIKKLNAEHKEKRSKQVQEPEPQLSSPLNDLSEQTEQPVKPIKPIKSIKPIKISTKKLKPTWRI